MNLPIEKKDAMRKGLLELAILHVIARKPVYAADILGALSQTEFSTQEGTLYPLLSKIGREDLVKYEWKESESGPPRKYYELTTKGRAQLSDMRAYWDLINATIRKL
ncbi:MAG: transcriptional regulator, PadR-like family [Patescibacteria group bacterium]|nr:transcriptional regulator, PadR-like family [Patescibacteria group bacterium]